MAESEQKIKGAAGLGTHEGRIKNPYAPEHVEYYYKPLVEQTKYLFDPILQYNRAHIVMLHDEGIIDQERAAAVLTAHDELEALGVDGVEFDPQLMGAYPNIESIIIDMTGYNAGGMLYLGRSRNDAQKVPERLAHRAIMLDILDEVNAVRRATLQTAAEHLETLMPNYTHLQHSQAMTFGYYLMWFVDAMEANFERLMGGYKRLNMSPAELGVGMGSGFAVSRERVAELLGYEGIIENALYAHRSLDREIECLGILSMTMLDVYRLCEDFHIWCSSDVDFLELDDAYSGTSFSMAQKKNPNGLAQMELAALMSHQTYNLLHDFAKRNTSEVILPGNQAGRFREEVMQTARGALMVAKGVISTIQVHKEPMAAQATASFSQGADLSDVLVRECGLSFREAYRVVAALVRAAYEQGKKPSEVTVDMLADAAIAALGKKVSLSAELFREAMDPMESIRAKKVIGSVAPDTVRDAIARKTDAVIRDEAWLLERRNTVIEADKLLAQACRDIIASPSD